MLLKIKPKQIERVRGKEIYGKFCLDDCIATYTSWINRDYELMYFDSWNFKCYNKGYLSDKSKWDNLEYYHGVKLTWHNSTLNNNTLEVFMNELKENRPILLSLDCFYCPWDWGYQNFHNDGHIFLISGFYDNQNLNCVDPYFLKENSLLSLYHFNNGFKRYATFSLMDIKKEYNLIDLLNASVRNLFNNQGDIFTKMRNFADFIVYSLDVQTELEECEDFSNSLLWNAFEDDFYGRIEYAIMLRYIAKKLGFSENSLMKISNRFLNIVERWQVAKGMLGKVFVMKESQEIKSRLALKIKEIADDEEKLALDLLDLINIQMNDNKEPDIIELNRDFSLINIGQEVDYVNLLDYYNNQGFGILSTDCTADLTGTGQYFIINDLSINEIWEIENISFKFPQTGNNIFDNISCMGQKITTPLDYYRNIMVLGCAEFGDFQDYINIFYLNGEMEKVLLQLTDYFGKPRFGEKIAWEGYVAYRNNNEVKLVELKHRLFLQICPINHNQQLSYIILPECPNLHIFAITLGK